MINDDAENNSYWESLATAAGDSDLSAEIEAAEVSELLARIYAEEAEAERRRLEYENSPEGIAEIDRIVRESLAKYSGENEYFDSDDWPCRMFTKPSRKVTKFGRVRMIF